MNNDTTTQQLRSLRSELAGATLERRQAIMRQIQQIRNAACYECQEHGKREEHYPFCSKSCHEAWARVYAAPQASQHAPSIEQMQARLYAIADEKRAARLGS